MSFFYAIKLNSLNKLLSCWTSGITQILSVILPISLHLIINTFVYVLIFKNQYSSKLKVATVLQFHSKNSENINRKKQLAILSTCFFNMGLTWGLSVLVTIPSSVYVQTVLAFLFSFFNSFQGFFIFIVYNLLSK